MSMGAAVPTNECVAFTLKEISNCAAQATTMPEAVGAIKPVNMRMDEIAQTTAIMMYKAIATGDRWPPKSLSEITPEAKEPTTATSGIRANVQVTSRGKAET